VGRGFARDDSGTVRRPGADRDDGLRLEVAIPVGSEAEVRIPELGFAPVVLSESGQAIWKDGTFRSGRPGITGAREDAGTVRVTAGSGRYTFVLAGSEAEATSVENRSARRPREFACRPACPEWSCRAKNRRGCVARQQVGGDIAAINELARAYKFPAERRAVHIRRERNGLHLGYGDVRNGNLSCSTAPDAAPERGGRKSTENLPRSNARSSVDAVESAD